MPRSVPFNPLKAFSLLVVFLTFSALAKPDPAAYPSAEAVPALFHPNLPEYVNANASPEKIVAEVSEQRRRSRHRDHGGHASTTLQRPDGWDDLELLDMVLIQTIDGGLHALERKTGVKLWSREGFGNRASDLVNSTYSGREVVKMRIRPKATYEHPNEVLETWDNNEQEEQYLQEPVYILDPHDGQLYVFVPQADSMGPGDLPDSSNGEEGTAKLQRLPITMEQLIDLSPFTFPQEHSHVFIGTKTTSMRAIDLQTGEDVSSFTPPAGKAGLDTTPASARESPEACDWNAEWGFKGKKGEGRNAKIDDGECESDIDDRPEDKLFIGQTSYLLSIHSHAYGLIQQLSHTRLVPNSIHRDLAAYWARHGQTKGEVYVRPSRSDGGGAYAAYAGRRGQDYSGSKRVGGEYENRWRVELTHDGRIYGFQQDVGVAWSTDLGSMGVAVFDVLLPAKSEAYPILLPQPPAYTPALFPSAELALQLAAPSTFVTTCEATSQGNATDEPTTETPEQELQSLVALSSCNYPLINLLTAPSDGSLLGRHNISDAVKERLPLLIESGESQTTSRRSSHNQQTRDGAPTSPARDTPSLRRRSGHPAAVDTNDNNSVEKQLPGTDAIGVTVSFDWWKWVSVFAVFFMTGTLARIGILRFRRWKTQQLRKEQSALKVLAPVSATDTSNDVSKMINSTQGEVIGGSTSSGSNVVSEDLHSITPHAGENVLDVTPVTPGTSESLKSNKLPTISPDQELEDLPQRTFKKRRRKRGKGKGKGKSGFDDGESDEEVDPDQKQGLNGSPERSPTLTKNGLQLDVDAKSLNTQIPDVATGDLEVKRKDVIAKLEGLKVSDDVLGYGSQGTVVFKGVFQGRAVAVKRLVADHFSIASQEVSLLQASDDHQNVVRYYYQEQRDMFLYIALELCPASLADIIDSPQRHQELASAFNPKKAMFQITSGLKHLHGLKIIHRDLKPQNVLITVNSSGQQRIVLSDFGLAKRLDQGQSSYLQTGNHPVGTTGWLAPECLTGEVDLDQGFDGSSSRHSRYTDDDGPKRFDAPKPKHGRLTRAVDLFALGCVYYYVITSGGHPYGGRYDRDRNIIRDEKELSALDSYGEDGFEAKALITKLLSPEAKQRPDAAICLCHPFFWTPGKRLNFLCEASDRFEIMQLDPPEATLVTLEKDSFRVVGQNWQKALDQVFVDNLGKHRKYVVQSVRDLLRAMRNKRNHYQDLPEAVKKRVGVLPDGYLNYFTARFPALFTHVHQVIYDSKLRHESQFAPYFILDEST
ncbi:hypothetical protein NliqN6_0582 [Naganishia liquefaciens]|uniref:non-specific serine/threonine protein kinase n=1 Tax=Naganishia liquefaciens TaxID=104408 RepID=A0A8H3TPH8_9TREE|nr:hypothetical protein NliqN6_0582 [Naganishia liquefaciens]